MAQRSYHSREYCLTCGTTTDWFVEGNRPPECGGCLERASGAKAEAKAEAKADTVPGFRFGDFTARTQARLLYLRWRVQSGLLTGDTAQGDAVAEVGG